jgi:hypothetical protein
MVFYFFFSGFPPFSFTLYCRTCKRLRDFEEIEISAKGKAVEVTVTRKEENSKNFVWFSSKNSASGHQKFVP